MFPVTPEISQFLPETPESGSRLTILGSNFWDREGKVTLNEQNLKIEKWTDKNIGMFFVIVFFGEKSRFSWVLLH